MSHILTHIHITTQEGFDLNPEEGAGQSLTFNMSVQVKTSKRKAEDVFSTAQSGSKDEEEVRHCEDIRSHHRHIVTTISSLLYSNSSLRFTLLLGSLRSSQFSMDALMRSSPSSGAEGSKRSTTLSIEDLQVEASVLAKSFKKAFDKVVQGDQKLYAGDKKAVQNMFGDDLVKVRSQFRSGLFHFWPSILTHPFAALLDRPPNADRHHQSKKGDHPAGQEPIPELQANIRHPL